MPSCNCPDHQKGNHCKVRSSRRSLQTSRSVVTGGRTAHSLCLFKSFGSQLAIRYPLLPKVGRIRSRSRKRFFTYSRALLGSELEQIFANSRPPPNDPSINRIKEAYEVATGKSPSKGQIEPEASGSNGKRSIPAECDDCPVC